MSRRFDTPRIKSAMRGAPGDTTLSIDWEGGHQSIVDLAGWIATGAGMLATLRDPSVFNKVRIAEHGAALAWADGDDDLMIDAVHLRLLSDEQKPFDRKQWLEWQREAGLSNQEAADFLGVSLSTVNAYKAGSRIPPVIGLACRAAARDPLLMQAHYRPRKGGRPRKRVVGAGDSGMLRRD